MKAVKKTNGDPEKEREFWNQTVSIKKKELEQTKKRYAGSTDSSHSKLIEKAQKEYDSAVSGKKKFEDDRMNLRRESESKTYTFKKGGKL